MLVEGTIFVRFKTREGESTIGKDYSPFKFGGVAGDVCTVTCEIDKRPSLLPLGIGWQRAVEVYARVVLPGGSMDIRPIKGYVRGGYGKLKRILDAIQKPVDAL